jgi:hypothetical protein
MESTKASVIDRTGTDSSMFSRSEPGNGASPSIPDRSAAYLADIRGRLMPPASAILIARLVDESLKRLRLAPKSAGASLFIVLAGTGLRLLIPLIVTAVAGQWADISLGQWSIIAVVIALFDVGRLRRHAPSAKSEQEAHAFTSMPARIASESDLRELADFTRRWYRLPVSAVVGVFLATAILLACFLVTPEGMGELPAGSIVLLATLLYEVGELAFISLFYVPFIAREATFDHRLFWLDPVNSSEVRDEMRAWAQFELARGVITTITLALAVVLVSPTSPVLLPLAAGLTLMGYVTTFASMAAVRSGVRKIVQRVRDRHLTLLQDRIDSYSPRFGELAAAESEELEHLIALYNSLRDAPSSPKRTESLGHAVVALIVPTVMFVITVFGEVYAERFLERFLH